MKFLEIMFVALLVEKCFCGQCPGSSIIHTTPNQPLQCQVLENCTSVTCHGFSTSKAVPEDWLTFHFHPCRATSSSTDPTAAPAVVFSGSLAGWGPFQDIRIEGPVQVPINQGELEIGSLQIIDWVATDNSLHFGTKVHSLASDGTLGLLLNATAATFNQTLKCGGSNGTDLLPSTNSPLSDLPPPLTTTTTACEVLQSVAARSSMCLVNTESCQALECSVMDFYRITVTLLPCGELPAVHVQVYHSLDETTLLRSTYTRTQSEMVYLGGESRLFDVEVSIDKSSRDHITLMLELAFPWGENHVIIPASQFPVNRSACFVGGGKATPPTTILAADPGTTIKSEPLEQQPIATETGFKDRSGQEPMTRVVVIASVSITAVLLVMLAAVIACSIVLHHKTNKKKSYLYRTFV